MGTHLIDVSLRQDDILLITIGGELVEGNLQLLKEDVERASAIISQESRRSLRPLPALVDLHTLNPIYAPEAILLIADFEKKNRPYIQKTVCFGANMKIKFAGEIISAFADRKNISFCETEEEALALLKK